MIWVIGYVVIGLLITGMALPSVWKRGKKNYESEEQEAVGFLIAALVGVLLVAPFWPMWLAALVTKPFRKKEGREQSNDR